jgi:imidazole glycerol phosphate synthase subunit HisF
VESSPADDDGGFVLHVWVRQVFEHTGAEAALAAGIFHRREVEISAVKAHLAKSGITVRTVV